MSSRFPVLRCSTHRGPAGGPWARALADSGVGNAFNPSMLEHAGTQHMSFRGYGPSGVTPFHSFYAQRVAGGAWTVTDLSDVVRDSGIPVAADPKLTLLDGNVFVTFNSGFSETANDLYLMRLWPTPGPAQRVEFDGRQRVEKNWGFFSGEGRLRVLYSLRPLIFLELDAGEVGADGDLHFAPAESGGGLEGPPGLTIGPQPVPDGDDLLVIAHEKIWLRGRRGYLGRPVRVRLPATSRASLEVSPVRLIESWSALVPRGQRHNPNLLFAAYFSGMYTTGHDVVLGCGVNDTGYSLAQFGKVDLWQ